MLLYILISILIDSFIQLLAYVTTKYFITLFISTNYKHHNNLNSGIDFADSHYYPNRYFRGNYEKNPWVLSLAFIYHKSEPGLFSEFQDRNPTQKPGNQIL